MVSRTPSWDRWLLLSDCLQSQGWGVHFPEQPAEGTAEPKTGHGRGWASDPGIEILEAHHLNCFRKMLRFRLFLESRKVICKTPPARQHLEGGHGALSEPRPHPTSLGSFLAGATACSLGLAVGKEKSRSMLEKSGSTTSASGLLSVAHMELPSAGEGPPVRLTPAPQVQGQVVRAGGLAGVLGLGPGPGQAYSRHLINAQPKKPSS